MSNPLTPDFQPSSSQMFVPSIDSVNPISTTTSGAMNVGYQMYPRYNVEKYWVSQEQPSCQFSMNALFGGSMSFDDSWGLYQVTNPSIYGETLEIWDCDSDPSSTKYVNCCGQNVKAVSYNSKMLVVWDTYDGLVNQGVGAISPTPLFWQTSASMTAPGDAEYNNFGSYPWKSLQQFANDLCPWNFSQSLLMSEGSEGLDWTYGVPYLLNNATNYQSMIIVKNNDVRGLDLYQCAQRYNPRMFNCWPLSHSLDKTAPEMRGLAPVMGPSDDAPYTDPYTGHVSAPFDDGLNITTTPQYRFSEDPTTISNGGNNTQTSESFFYGDPSNYGLGGYFWKVKPNTSLGLESLCMTGSATIEFLIKPANETAGPVVDPFNPLIPFVNGVPYLPGKFMPIFCKSGNTGDGGVYVDTEVSNSLCFVWTDDNSYQMIFTSSADLLNYGYNDTDDCPTWFHCAVTRNFTNQNTATSDDQFCKWYINGKPVHSSSAAWFTNPYMKCDAKGFWIIGSDSGSKSWTTSQETYYSGSIGFIRAYNRCLNQYSIKTNFYRSGMFCEYEGFNQPYTFDYDGEEVTYYLNGGSTKECQLEILIDHGNLVCDNGQWKSTPTGKIQHIYNIREWREGNGWSGSRFPYATGQENTNNMFISQSSDGYQIYDGQNGARYYPGSKAGAHGHGAEYAHEYINHVHSDYEAAKVNAGNTLEMWVRLSHNTSSNQGFAGSSQNKVIFCYDQRFHGRPHDFGIMYNADGIGFYGGNTHLGVSWDDCTEYFGIKEREDRWCFIQAIIPPSTWNNVDEGDGFVLGFNGNYWGKGVQWQGYTLPSLVELSGTGWNAFNVFPTSSLNFMGQYNGTHEYNASGSIAEIRYYSQKLVYRGTANYAVNTTSSIVYNQTDIEFNWLRHNWNASKTRFGMGGDASWT